MKTYYILDIPFIEGVYKDTIIRLKRGGLMVVPSGPGLSTVGKDSQYTEAVKKADFAIPDSGFMIFLLRWLKGIKIKKLSGFKFLNKFLKENFQKNELFLIDPNSYESKKNNDYLNKIGIPIEQSNHYVAPIYNKNKVEDIELINILNRLKNKPKYIMINLGSNIQEPLGYFLKKNLTFKPGIICTGAAISFFTGTQVKMYPLIDRLSLGWLRRIMKNPSIFFPRYFRALSLFFLILKSDVEVR